MSRNVTSGQLRALGRQQGSQIPCQWLQAWQGLAECVCRDNGLHQPLVTALKDKGWGQVTANDQDYPRISVIHRPSGRSSFFLSFSPAPTPHPAPTYFSKCEGLGWGGGEAVCVRRTQGCVLVRLSLAVFLAHGRPSKQGGNGVNSAAPRTWTFKNRYRKFKTFHCEPVWPSGKALCW